MQKAAPAGSRTAHMGQVTGPKPANDGLEGLCSRVSISLFAPVKSQVKPQFV